LTTLALCHTVNITGSNNKKRKPSTKRTSTLRRPSFRSPQPAFEYQASSPDEKALAEACQRLSYYFSFFVISILHSCNDLDLELFTAAKKIAFVQYRSMEKKEAIVDYMSWSLIQTESVCLSLFNSPMILFGFSVKGLKTLFFLSALLGKLIKLSSI